MAGRLEERNSGVSKQVLDHVTPFGVPEFRNLTKSLLKSGCKRNCWKDRIVKIAQRRAIYLERRAGRGGWVQPPEIQLSPPILGQRDRRRITSFLTLPNPALECRYCFQEKGWYTFAHTFKSTPKQASSSSIAFPPPHQPQPSPSTLPLLGPSCTQCAQHVSSLTVSNLAPSSTTAGRALAFCTSPLHESCRGLRS
ncbi:uncharacterized protein BDZ99DRAFT_278121 [Mytilinidion resinicola]|uniref:Uncharacterized protein n=1 Tax=Mytilinidion resinicola TaxID=574789 RepID=A0A6A6YTC9_9PEZI|nr:uncharacterized protein BDZ99DRAFT_278121 [Mytilinidion resinicola]KAF2811623.1 hypothetical protein BDZ99DRAFT_278121 [Mytilinidion resinicola]